MHIIHEMMYQIGIMVILFTKDTGIIQKIYHLILGVGKESGGFSKKGKNPIDLLTKTDIIK